MVTRHFVNDLFPPAGNERFLRSAFPVGPGAETPGPLASGI